MSRAGVANSDESNVVYVTQSERQKTFCLRAECIILKTNGKLNSECIKDPG